MSDSSILFQNVRIFDGTSDALSVASNVLTRGNQIERISTGAIAADAATTVIAGGGRTLMPGLIDAHWHSMFAATPLHVGLTANFGYLNLLAAREAGNTLMRGFTTVRDIGGPVFGLKRAIDEGVVIGPRIYPSGAMITQHRRPRRFPPCLRDSARHQAHRSASLRADRNAMASPTVRMKCASACASS